MKFFTPPLDSQGMPIKTACIDVLKRAIFKLACTFERVNLFTIGKVRARSVTLDSVRSDITDQIELFKDKNPFKMNHNEP